MLPTREQAHKLLSEAEEANPGAWGKHSETVAECAEKIAKTCGLDSEKAYVLGLLHDIGRKFGVTQFRHIVDGHCYMNELGFDEAARVCLSHSFSTQCIEDAIVKVDVSEAEFAECKTQLEQLQFDDYDKLIQLCDSLAGVEVVDMNERMDDVARRYGSYPAEKRQMNLRLKAYFEQRCGKNIYTVVSDNQELWGL